MTSFQIHSRWLRLMLLLGSLFFSGCLPKNCGKGVVAALQGAKVQISKLSLIDDNRDGSGASGGGGSGAGRRGPMRTPVCTEFAGISSKAEEILIFVDKDQKRDDGGGESWADARKTINSAVSLALDIRRTESISGEPFKKIYIIVAGGTYNLVHEYAGKPTAKNASIINFDGLDLVLSRNIEILGGYRVNDACLERQKNVDADAEGETGRETILDGENDGGEFSNHVVNIADNAEDITIKHFTIKNGKALSDIGHEPFRKSGGAILIRTAAKNIRLEELTISNSEAEESGGCIAILGSVPASALENVTLKDVTMTRCISNNGNGGGLYLSGNVRLVRAENFEISNSESLFFDGGGIFVDDNVADLRFERMHLENNQALRGGGLAIYGGGVNAIAVANSTIKGNTAASVGGGVFISEKAPVPLQLLAPALPPAKFSFTNVNIDGNTVTNAIDGTGAGVAIHGPAGDVKFHGGSISKNVGDVPGIGLAVVGAVNHVEIDDVTFKKNRTLNAAVERDGNGIYLNNVGGNNPGRIVIKNSRVEKHTKGDRGAALFAQNVRGLTVENVTFTKNTSVHSGGAVYINQVFVMGHTRNTYSENISYGHGGALFVSHSMNDVLNAPSKPFPMTQITCTANWARSDGGCAAIERAPRTVITNCLFNRNGIVPATEIGEHPPQRGGALAYFSDSLNLGLDHGASLLITQSSFGDNRASNQGGAVFAEHVFDLELDNQVLFHDNIVENYGLNYGGGAVFANVASHPHAASLAHRKGASIQLSGHVYFNRNRANASGGAIRTTTGVRKFTTDDSGILFDNNSSTRGHGGAIYVDFFRPVVMDDSELLLDAETTFSENRAMSDADAAKGGAVYAQVSPRTAKFFGIFQFNQAYAGGGAVMLGGVSVIDRLITKNEVYPAAIKTIFIHNSTTTGNGGALLVQPNIQNSNAVMGRYANNVAGGSWLPNHHAINWQDNISVGGAIAFMGGFVNPAIFKFENAEFVHNAAGSHNAAVHFANAPQSGLSFTKTTFYGHTRRSNGCGGAMKIDGEIDRMNFSADSLVHGNKTTNGDGGALCVGKINVGLWLTNTTVSANEAQGGGGFLYVENESANLRIDVQDSKIEANKALGDNGGALHIPKIGPALMVYQTAVERNEAHGAGGFMFVANDSPNSDIAMLDSTFVENKAFGGNGGVMSMPLAKNVSLSQAIRLQDMLTAFEERFDGERQGLLEGDELVKLSRENTAQGSGGAFYFNRIIEDLRINHQLWFFNKALNGSGGFIAVNNVRNVNFVDSMFYSNSASLDGGVAAISNAADVSINSFERPNKTHPFKVEVADPPLLQIADSRSIFADPDYVAPLAAVLSNQKALATLNGLFAAKPFYRLIDKGNPLYLYADLNVADSHFINSYRGHFLIEGNTAQRNGGAMFIDNVANVKIERMSFLENTAPAGSGGTLYIANLDDLTTLISSIIMSGSARDNAGAIFVEGNNVPNAQRRFALDGTSIQNSKVTQGIGPSGAAGIYLSRMNRLIVQDSNFYGNSVDNTLAGAQWAAALKFATTTTDPLPATNPLFLGEHDVVNDQLLDMARMPVQFVKSHKIHKREKLEFFNNEVNGAGQATSIGTVAIPPIFHNAVAFHGPALNYFFRFSSADMFRVGNNTPAPVDEHPKNVIVAQ